MIQTGSTETTLHVSTTIQIEIRTAIRISGIIITSEIKTNGKIATITTATITATIDGTETKIDEITTITTAIIVIETTATTATIIITATTIDRIIMVTEISTAMETPATILTLMHNRNKINTKTH